jgi:hypothetical protein
MRWFRNTKFVHVPVSTPGYLITAAGLVFCLSVSIAFDGSSRSASDTLYGVLPYWAGAFLLYEYIASRKDAK